MAVSDPSLSLSEAAQILGTEDIAEARRVARLELSLARACPVCRVLMRRVALLGVELRARELVERLTPWERDEHSVRLVAALIVLHGW